MAAAEELPKKSSNDELKPHVFHDENLVVSNGLDDSIESTLPGKAIWLIACTVSMGGFLFGKHDIQYPVVLFGNGSSGIISLS